ncbi:MAG: protease inhibitor I42 family protein [Clostridia bacterium]|nr:protease inhibitor I42 family protein [Clostridia bacterium]
MKKIKKLSCLVLSLTIAVLCAVPVMAEDNLPSTGLIWDTWESYLENMNINTLYALTTQRKGDINGDGTITAADARLCLRAAAQLEELTEPQIDAADVNNKSGITSADARKILRISAGLDASENMTVETTADWGFIIGPLNGSGSGQYYWQCEIDYEGLSVTQESIDTPEGVDGASAKTFFVFTPEKPGKYTVTLKLADSKQENVVDEFQVNILVNAEVVNISQGEQFIVDGLKNAGSGRYNWKCTVVPAAGVTVTERTINNDTPADGAPIEQVFTFTGNKAGEYQVHFELVATNESTVINEFYLDIIVV